jgi:hypothetical protein
VAHVDSTDIPAVFGINVAIAHQVTIAGSLFDL